MSTLPNLTPYAAAQVTNKVLAAAGIEKTITPQMMYGYAKKGTIATVEGTKKVTFDGNAFKIWLDSYVKGGAPTGKQDFDKLAEAFTTKPAEVTEETVEETVAK
jgi:hypothetical protein